MTWLERSQLAGQMRQTAQALDRDHPGLPAGDHLRDAAALLEQDAPSAAKRHLDAATELFTPRNLLRRGIHDDQGHVAAKQAMSKIHRHRLGVQDTEDATAAVRAAVREGQFDDIPG